MKKLAIGLFAVMAMFLATNVASAECATQTENCKCNCVKTCNCECCKKGDCTCSKDCKCHKAECTCKKCDCGCTTCKKTHKFFIKRTKCNCEKPAIPCNCDK